EAETLIGQRELGHAAIDVAAGEPGARTEVLAPTQTPGALAAGVAEPRHPDQRSRCGPRGRIRRDTDLGLLGPRFARRARGLDACDDLVAEHARRLRDLELSVEQVQVRAADPAGVDSQQELSLLRLGDLALERPQ